MVVQSIAKHDARRLTTLLSGLAHKKDPRRRVISGEWKFPPPPPSLPHSSLKRLTKGPEGATLTPSGRGAQGRMDKACEPHPHIGSRRGRFFGGQENKKRRLYAFGPRTRGRSSGKTSRCGDVDAELYFRKPSMRFDCGDRGGTIWSLFGPSWPAQ